MTSLTWREMVATAAIDADDARRIGEEVSGWVPGEWSQHLDDDVPALGRHRFDAMVERRAAGEPLQYVLGSWGFRRLDLLVDRRVLIPRPETEWVVEVALRDLPKGEPRTVVDLGTGSGAIALSIADERWPHVRVIATDSSPDALAVARANLAGLGRRGTGVELREGDWYEVLDSPVDLIVSNPPYVATPDALPPEVADWEPASALYAGADGLDALRVIVAGARDWLTPAGVLVCEIGETQGAAVVELARAAGFDDVAVEPDLAGRDRVLVAR